MIFSIHKKLSMLKKFENARTKFWESRWTRHNIVFHLSLQINFIGQNRHVRISAQTSFSVDIQKFKFFWSKVAWRPQTKQLVDNFKRFRNKSGLGFGLTRSVSLLSSSCQIYISYHRILWYETTQIFKCICSFSSDIFKKQNTHGHLTSITFLRIFLAQEIPFKSMQT